MRTITRHHDLRSEDGAILITAIVLLAIMLAIGLSSFAVVGGGQERTREQRERETSLNLTEAVLYSQGFALAQTWPGNAAGGASMPTTCTQAAVQALCPNPNTLAAANSSTPAAANFTSADASANVTWTTRIRDNGGPVADAFSLSQADAAQSGTNARTGAAYTCPGPCRWDANGDLKLWVQARSVVRGRPRSVVALLKREQFSEAFPRNGVTAGSFATSNQGNKAIIDSTGSQVVVRCTTTGSECTDYNSGKGQVLPAAIVRDASYPPAMSADQIARFKTVAQTANPPTYYTSCPATYTGTVVFVDVPAGTVCSDTNNAVYNSRLEPGIVIMPRGRMNDIKGTYFGILYLGNEEKSTGPVLTLAANAQVCGGVAIDGPGRLVAGQSSGGPSACDPARTASTVMFRDNAFNSLATFGTTGLVQNTWRELPPS